MDACRSYLELPHFNRDVIFNKSHAAAGLCEWAVNIVLYFDVVSEVMTSRTVMAKHGRCCSGLCCLLGLVNTWSNQHCAVPPVLLVLKAPPSTSSAGLALLT